jgi:hypothetical protein
MRQDAKRGDKMRQIEDVSELEAKHDQLIFSLLREKTRALAAAKAGIHPSTMYRWMQNPAFKAKYRAALRDRFQDCVAELAKNAVDAAHTLVDAAADVEEEMSVRIVAAKAVIDRAFKAQDTIAVQEGLDHLRATLESLEAGPVPTAPVAEKPVETVRMENNHEEAEAAVLRVQWMGEVGNNAQDIADSLRYNRPTSVANEQELLDIVRQMEEVAKVNAEALSAIEPF